MPPLIAAAKAVNRYRSASRRLQTQTPANDNGMSPWVWVAVVISGLCDLFKMFLFLLNGMVGVGTAIDAVGSFIVSVLQITGVFGMLWYHGIYRGKSWIPNMLITLGVSAADLVPIVDDVPFTTPAVIFMILKNKAAGALKNAALPAAANDSGQQEQKEAA